MPVASLNGTIQESVLTLLVHDDISGRIASQIVTPDIFEGDYKVVAAAALDYWRKYRQPAGAHIDDELGHILSDPKNRRAPTYRRIITSMLTLSQSMNPPYILNRVTNFVRMQELKGAILDSAKQLEKPQGDLAVEDIEKVFAQLLRTRRQGFSPGLRLAQYDRMLAYLDTADEFQMGIEQLDQRWCAPSRGTTVLLLGAAGKGKSWFLVNVGRRALAMRKRVLHISLEMSEEQVMQRYYQSIFSASKRKLVDSSGNPLAMRQVGFLFDEADKPKFVGFQHEDLSPNFSLDSGMIREELSARVDHYEQRYQNLIIKRFPPRKLDVDGLNAFLDQLELVEGFIPDLLILDYMGLWKTDSKNHRISLGHSFEEFRGVAVERNLAAVTAHQLSKAGAAAITAKGIHVAEDWSMIGTSDIVLTYSVTDWEFAYGLGRLQASKIRDEQDRFNILMTQNYAVGQFCIESMYLPTNYFDLVEAKQEAAGIDSGKGDESEEENSRGSSRYERGLGG